MNMKRNFVTGLMIVLMLIGISIGTPTSVQAGTLPQTITFDISSQLPKTYGDAPFTLAATAVPSELPVSFASSNPAVATVSGNLVTIIGAGTATITASQDGDANYAAAVPVDQQLTVSKKPVTVTAVPYSKIYGDGVSIPYVISPPSLIAGDYFYGVLGRAMGENVGQYLVNVGNLCVMTPGKLCNDNYNLTFDPAPVLFTITPRPITVTADAKSKAWNDPDPALTFQITSGNFTFATYIVDGNLITDNNFSGSLVRAAGEEVGTPYVISQGTLALSTNYILSYVPADLTITKATPIIMSAPAATRITSGQALSASTLTGSASVPGNLAFTTPGTIPPAGSYSAPITFTPTDTTHFENLYRTVAVAVGLPNSVQIRREGNFFHSYDFIEDAFAAPPVDGDIIEMRDIDFHLGDQVLNSNIALTFKGGFSALFNDNAGPNSILHGSLTVKQGTLTVEKVTIKPVE
jgi:hypothetical protein